MSKKLIQITAGPSITNMSYFIGVLDNGDGTGTDYRYSMAQVASYFAGINKKVIVVSATATTITDPFFSNTITEIVMDTQTYQAGVDFTQAGTVITGITISFTASQQIIAKL